MFPFSQLIQTKTMLFNHYESTNLASHSKEEGKERKYFPLCWSKKGKLQQKASSHLYKVMLNLPVVMR